MHVSPRTPVCQPGNPVPGRSGLNPFCAALVVGSLIVGGAQAQSPEEWPLTDFETRSIELSEVTSGGPPRDGIPPIDSPKFVDSEAADEWLDSQEPVIALDLDGDARAYPLQILMYHEIVNDTVGGVPVSVTFCPLCNASIVFDRRVEDKVLDFGTTGWLRKSDLVMYDRQTESWWQQFVGRGIIGHYTDQELVQLPSVIVSYETFKETYGDGKILSRETGFRRNYGSNPYSGYDSITSSPFLYRGELDPRLPPMERILSLPDGDSYQLLPLTALEERAVVNTRLSDQAMVVFAPGTAVSALDKYEIAESRKIPSAAAFLASIDDQELTFEWKDGVIVDEQTGSQWNAFGHAVAGELKGQRLAQLDRGVHFAFAWLAFDPEAKILQPE
ncbi:MAG: DUF3179 domain-containing protein [Gammaproteobacteria bacterium]|nr:DUF3179 domain-containing protein [Gammaproteobacteria bacterium]